MTPSRDIFCRVQRHVQSWVFTWPCSLVTSNPVKSNWPGTCSGLNSRLPWASDKELGCAERWLTLETGAVMSKGQWHPGNRWMLAKPLEILKPHKREVRIMFQKLTGDNHLNCHKHKMGPCPTSVCNKCGRDDEVSTPVLCQCPADAGLRLSKFTIESKWGKVMKRF